MGRRIVNAFITGGSRGIGRAIVLRFASEGAGCAFTYAGNRKAADETLRLAKEIAPDSQFQAYQLNVSDPNAVESTIDTVVDDFDTINVVVNNAAVVKNNAAVVMSDEEWREVIDTNLSGPFYVARGFLMHFLANKSGRIINISSLAQEGASGQVNYAASKAGLIGLTKTLAREYGAKNITTNIVTVGYVETDMTDANLKDTLRDVWLSYCPMKRIGTAEEIASAVFYLSRPESGFINGEVLNVSGGLTYVP
jgi:3-oxoacyl-[acyl-carrier protein] reductase